LNIRQLYGGSWRKSSHGYAKTIHLFVAASTIDKAAILDGAAEWWEAAMMNGMMGVGMTWGMGVAFLLLVVAMLLIVALLIALIKYIFYR
jgi:hypothetical protein